VRIKENRLSPSAAKKFWRHPNDYAAYLCGLGTRSPAAAKGRDIHADIADAIMGRPCSEKAAGIVASAWKHGVITHPAGVELHVEADVTDGVAIHGFLDYLDGGDLMTVVDWKSGQWWAEDEDQVRWYCLMVEALGLPVGGATLCYTATSRVKEIRPVSWSEADKTKTVESITNTIHAILAEPVPPYVEFPARGVTFVDDYPRNIEVCSEGDVVALERKIAGNGEEGLAIIRQGRQVGWMPAEILPVVTGTEAVIAAVFLPSYEWSDKTQTLEHKKSGGLRIAVPVEGLAVRL
jgi:hypothetical protein